MFKAFCDSTITWKSSRSCFKCLNFWYITASFARYGSQVTRSLPLRPRPTSQMKVRSLLEETNNQLTEALEQVSHCLGDSSLIVVLQRSIELRERCLLSWDSSHPIITSIYTLIAEKNFLGRRPPCFTLWKHWFGDSSFSSNLPLTSFDDGLLPRRTASIIF